MEENKENKEKNRMLELSKALDKKNEVFKEDRDETNAEKLSEEYKRLSELASGEKAGTIQETQGGNFMGGDASGGMNGTNQPRSVSSIVDNLYSNPTLYQGAQANTISLKSDEALNIAIKRTLESGAPVNDIAFYDEVNWNLSQLGFPTKLPQDIKNAILDLIK